MFLFVIVMIFGVRKVIFDFSFNDRKQGSSFLSNKSGVYTRSRHIFISFQQFLVFELILGLKNSQDAF
jgi:hypothetical protein